MVRCVCVLIVGMGLAACKPSQTTEIRPADALPTRTIAPPTLTPTVPTGPVTVTPTDLPGPGELLPAAMTATPEALTPLDIRGRALQHLVTEHNIAPDTVRLITMDEFTWHDATWGCATIAEELDTNTRADTETHGYRVVFSAGTRIFAYHADTQGEFFLCNDRDWLAREGIPVVSDPIAAAMLQLSLADAARRVEPDTPLIPTSVITLTWPDASLGCPKPDADYDDRPTQGYRIVLRSGNEQIIYHTSSQHIMYCTPEDEILPGILRRALPSPTPTSTADD
ncbi:MAG: hypothetical protein K8S97_11960 [Anaerolineae bacterium]|nr:hypothetical protein [Anaerolineae bacterium]